MSVEITEAVAVKVRDTVDAGLSFGVGTPIPGQMCVEAAVCYALGLEHGDDPGCVSQALRRLKIRLNDAAWSSPAARGAGLRRLALAQLGSAGVLDEREFVRRVAEMTIRKAVPSGLRAAARRLAARGHAEHAAKLEAAAVRCETDGTREAARDGERVARAAATASTTSAAYAAADAADAAAYAAADAAYAAAAYAADAADAAACAAADVDAAAAADAAAYAAAAYAADAADAAACAAADAAPARDRALAEYAEWVVEILIDMQAPGCQWLRLVPKAA